MRSLTRKFFLCTFLICDLHVAWRLAVNSKSMMELNATLANSKKSRDGRPSGQGDLIFALLADPQLGMLHAYDQDKKTVGIMDEELDVFRQIVKILVEIEDELEFVAVLGDMQQYYPTGRNNLLLDTDMGSKQREAVDEVLSTLSVPVRVLPGNHDIDDKVTKGVLAGYQQFWGRDFYSFPAKGINFIVLNSQLYYDADEDLRAYKSAQTQFFMNEIQKGPNNVVLTHIPPFIKGIDDHRGWGNWHDRYLFRAANHPNFPKQWFCGHLHKNAVNTVGGVEIVVSSSCASTMDWEGRTEDFTPEQALETMRIPPAGLGAAVSRLYANGGKIGPGKHRSGVRFVRCNAQRKPLCRHVWVTLADLAQTANLSRII